MRITTGLVVGLVCGLIGSMAQAAESGQRTLSFEDRVKAQRAIERVYYSHQLGATKTFDEAVRTAVLEAKVRKYMDQTAALNAYWKTAVTDQTLQRELTRMAQGTKMPERLLELYAALGNDPFLIKECLTRPALVDRLMQNFYAFDPTLHVKAKAHADAIHGQLVLGALSASAEHPNRMVSELVVGESEVGVAPTVPLSKTGLTAEEFKTRRAELPVRPGVLSEIREARDAFVFNVVLSETPTSVRFASYVVAKTAWDVWWESARRTVRGDAVTAVASGAIDLPVPRQSASAGVTTGCADDTWDNGILDATPEPRSRHTAIWTGAEMIIWGGSSSYSSPYTSPHLNTGWRYDPATDSWRSIATRDAPSGRYEHVAVWTGHVMVIWGGQSYYDSMGHYLNTGGRYDPSTDSWTATSTVAAPTARIVPTAVWTGHVMVVWGGYQLYYGGLDTGGRYDPTTDRWEPTSMAGAPQRRHSHSAVWTGRTMVVWGGDGIQPEYPNNSGPLNNGGRYDPGTDTWAPMATAGAPSKREYHGAVWTGHEIVVWGGVGQELSGGNGELRSGGKYNPETDSWTATSTAGAPVGRYPVVAVWTGRTMTVWGGGRYNEPELGDGGQYDPATDAWTPTSTVGAPSPRDHHSIVWTGSLMIVWGSDYPTNTGGRYDPATDRWTPTSTAGAPATRNLPSAVWTGNVMAVWGGSRGLTVNTGGRYDPTLDVWTPITTQGAPSERVGHTAVWTGSRMVVWGGVLFDYYHPQFQYFNTGGNYDPISDSWTPTSATGAPVGRTDHTAVWTGSQMVVWGGDSGYFGGILNSGGRYDPVTDSWTATSATGAPAARYWHTAIWTGNVMVVWGGNSDGSPFLTNTGGRYDPATDSWAPTSLASVPEARRFHTAVWTGSVMVVWGGYVDTGPSNDATTSGRYDPTTDRWIATAGGPAGRIRFSSVWTGSQMVIWGGTNDDQEVFNTGWRYDPYTDIWTPTSTDGAPTPRSHHAAVWTGTMMLVWGGDYDNGGRYVIATSSTDDCDGDGYSVADGDCDPARPSVYPGAPQICDGLNNDCSDSSWPTVPAVERNADGDAFPVCAGDCDDTQASVFPGAPERCNGVDDDCDGAVDNGGDAYCDDDNPCTDDSCQGTNGCLIVNNTRECDDANVCTSGDACSEGLCDGAPVEDIPCDDGNACTANDTCVGGSCSGGSPLGCNDGNACNGVETCSPWTGCIAGVSLACDDRNACTDDSCSPASGCVFLNNAKSCDDENDCTVADICDGGGCRGTPNSGNACDDHDACSVGDYCYYGRCFGGSYLECDDGNVCNGFEFCNPDVGCGTDYPPICDDGNPCNGVETCDPATGCRNGTQPNCNDDNPCTDDSCAPAAGGCAHANNDANTCSDANACSRTDKCLAGVCTGLDPVQCGGGCPDGSASVGGLCQKTYEIDASLLDNQDARCDGTESNRYNDCNGQAYGFHWTDLAGALVVVTRVDVEFESGLNCGGTASTVTLNGAPAGSFELVGSCGCDSQHGSISLPNLDPDTYTPAGVNLISIAPSSTCEGLSRSPILDNHFARVTVTYRPIHFACRVATCDPVTGACGTSDLPDGTECSDDDACTNGDACDAGTCEGTALNCDDNNPCTDDACDPATGCAHVSNESACDDGNACTTGDACGGGTCNGGGSLHCDDGNYCNGLELCDPGRGCVAGADLICGDNNPCTDDSCESTIGCVFTNSNNACDDGNACTTGDACDGGICRGGTSLACSDGNGCTTDSCNPATGCVFTNNTNPCDDGNACTRTDACSAGSCVGGNPVTCGTPDQCHDSGTCNPGTGTCPNPTKPDGTVCDDASLCTTGETCQSGTCTPALSGLNHPTPKSAGYYKKLCQQREHNPSHYQGDELTESDAACVGQLTSTFAGMATVDELCEVINTDHRPPHGGRHHGGSGDGPNGKDCDKGENELIATALNICRAWVCEEQNLDSRCHGNTHSTVSQSFADADAILDDAARNKDTCKSATCELREINNGHALEMNSLALARENGKVRLTWSSPVLDDGSGEASSFELWRRPMGSNDSFVKIGTTSGLTFLDATAGTAAWEYDITAVIPGN